MRRLGRIGIFTSSSNKFLVNLKRSHKELFDTVDKDQITGNLDLAIFKKMPKMQ
jgi:hypothetical protein